jgi:putative transposase
MRAKIFIGAGTFFETQKKSLRQAWRLTNKQFYMIKTTTQDKVVLKLGEKYPSYDQFKYWYYKQRDYKESILRREGERKTNLKYRPLSGRSSDISFGPGSMFQIDATMGDVNLVSVFNRLRLIGRPIVYLVVDVFSHLIVGFYVGIENMSKVCAMMALENTFTNKIEICRRYGVNISEDEWYCHHTPEALLADRAELAGYYGSQIVKNLGIDLANTAPYRADMKGLVEQLFNLLNIVAIHDIPGATSKHQERGDRDSRLDAILNIYEFTQLLIHAILYLNMRRLKNYPFKSDLVQQQVDLRPISLWHWGLAHRNGKLGILDPTSIRTSLLPRKEASVRSNGIRFNGHTYVSPEIEHWFMKARKEGSWKVDIGYHPHVAKNIYLYLPGQREPIILCLKFFEMVDYVLGTSYSKTHGKGSYTEDVLVENMARIALLQGLGILIIDEIQNLSVAKSGGAEEMINFLVCLVNTIGLPVILIGTPEADNILNSKFQQVRRSSGENLEPWLPMIKGPEWDYFLEGLWHINIQKK